MAAIESFPGEELLVEQLYQPLLRFAARLAGNAAEAADLTQQTFYIAQTRRHQLRDAGRIRAWLFTTLRREFLQRRRRTLRFPQIELDTARAELPHTDADAGRRLDGIVVLAGLKALDKRYQAPLCLFYFEGQSYRRIAAILAVPVGTVMSRIARGKQKLRERLERGRTSRRAWDGAPPAAQRATRRK